MAAHDGRTTLPVTGTAQWTFYLTTYLLYCPCLKSSSGYDMDGEVLVIQAPLLWLAFGFPDRHSTGRGKKF